MKYDISCLLEGANCRVVFVSDPKDSIEIENAVYEREPRYKHEINKAFASMKKVGPFKIKNKTSIWKILKNTEAVDEEGLEFLNQQIKRIDLYYYADRSARALSNQQRMRASVLYETLNGRTRLLLNDCYAVLDGKTAQNKGKDAFFNVASWIEKYPFDEFRGYDFIWITDMSVNEFFKQMGDNALNSDRYRYFIAENGSVTKLDADKLKGCAETARPKEEEPKQSTLEEAKQRVERHKEKSNEQPKAEQKHVQQKTPAREVTADTVIEYEHAEKCYKDKLYSLALPYYENVAATGHLRSQMMCAQMYFQGQGCEADPQKALSWWERAAEQGYALAQKNCAFMYSNGKGCKVDLERALYWKEKAAEQGDAQAQFEVGMMYELGQGCAASPAKARAWYEKAAAQGHADAQRLLDGMSDSY